MVDKTTGFGKALWLGALLAAAMATTTANAQGMIGTTPVKQTTPTGVPTISGNPSRMLVAGTFYDFRPSASDPNGDRLTFTISRLPRWATFDPATGRLYGTPVTSDVGKIKGIVIAVTDGTNKKSLPKFSIKVVAGKGPQINGNPGKDAKEGEAYAFQPSASDPDGQKLEYGIINKPSWANFDASTGRLAGTPPKGSAGTYANVGISVTDGANTASLAPFSITVAASPNTAPKITGTPAASVQVGQVYDFVPAASDAEGDALRFAIVNKPSWATFDAATGRLTGKPAMGNEGAYADVVISVSDNALISFLSPFTVNVTAAPATKPPAPNNPPTISGQAPTAAVEGSAYVFQPSASDADGDPLVFSAANLPTWLAIDPATGRLAGTPGTGSSGTYSGIVVTVSDGKAPVSLPAFSVTVTKPSGNSAPVISGTPANSIRAGYYYSFKPNVSDADGDTLSFAIMNKPSWATFNFQTGELIGNTTDADVGTFANIRISVSDGKVAAALPIFTITVNSGSTPNGAPTISGNPSGSAKEGVAYSFLPSASDPDGQSLVFGIANKPSWATFEPASGRLSGTPGAGTAGTYSNIVISVSDGQASATLPAFSIVVAAGAVQNRAPTISGTAATSAVEGQAYAFQPVASDPDGDVLAFGVANKPSWANFDPATGRLSGTPGTGTAGTYSNIVISVSDGKASATLTGFSITVSAQPVANRAPTISGSPTATVTEGSAYSFQPSASDADGDPLTFSATGVPSWATFNTSTGKLSGTPAKGTAGTYSGIVITVSDGKLSASLPAFSITVAAAPNNPPTISGTPATTVTAGQAYSFVPTASDPDGQTLGYGIANKPSWANFDINTGRLSGTPGEAQAGTYSNIVISVSDGKLSATLPAFAITVKSATPVVGSADLTWTAPTQNEDGSALTNLAGYKIRYGTSPGALNQVVTVANPATTSTSIGNLAAGTWYFTVASYTNTGVESAPAGPVYKTIQ